MRLPTDPTPGSPPYGSYNGAGIPLYDLTKFLVIVANSIQKGSKILFEAGVVSKSTGSCEKNCTVTP
jgi:hypothetical protein